MKWISLVGWLALSLSLASAQKAARREGSPLRAARFLGELQTNDNGGVRASGDLDGDGDVDLLMLRYQGSSPYPRGIQSWRNQGDGRFVLAHDLVLAVPTYRNYWEFELAHELELADVTGDGVLDLVYERKDLNHRIGPSGVLVHAGLGDGSFGPSTFIDTNGGVGELAVGDCDGDGDADILVHQWNTDTDSQGTLVWWHDDAGTFVAGAPLSVATDAPWPLVALDLGGDGIADAVSGSSWGGHDSVRVFRTVNGAPTLEAELPLPSELWNVNQRILTGDIDGDGAQDVLVILDDLLLHRFYFQPILRTTTGWITKPLQRIDSPGEPLVSAGGVLADWDGDGDSDYVSPRLSWLENVGGASFVFAGSVYATASETLQVADFDGDGHLDAMVRWDQFLGDGRLPRATSVPTPGEPLGASVDLVEDWEHDGDLDLVASMSLNDGTGRFTRRATSLPSEGGMVLQFVGWGDFDGDGFRDLVEGAFRDNTPYPPTFVAMRLFRGTESGAYASSPVVPSPIEMPALPNLSGDIDGDGDQDILTVDGFWANDGAAHFAMIAAYIGQPLQALDVDRDGDLDLTVHRGANLELLVNRGGAVFQRVSFGAYGSGAFGSAPFVRFLDADEDGDLDLLVTRSGVDGITLHAQLGAGVFAAPLTLQAPAVNGPVGQMDVDGDGRLDLVVGRLAPVQVLLAWIRGRGLTFSEQREWRVREAPLAFADCDGDGDIEALGTYRLENFQFDGPSAGAAEQYALDGATPGTLGVHPVLGARGPLRPGGEGELVIGRGLGHAAGVLLAGRSRSSTVVGGLTLFVAPQVVFRSFVLGGSAGVAGAGETTLHLPLEALSGRTLTFQALLVDPGVSGGLSATNGLELRFGSL